VAQRKVGISYCCENEIMRPPLGDVYSTVLHIGHYLQPTLPFHFLFHFSFMRHLQAFYLFAINYTGLWGFKISGPTC